MVKGTTPTFKLTINDDSVNLLDASNIYVTFKQPCGISLTKSGGSLDVSAKEVDVYLSQEDTLLFVEGPMGIQLNWTYQDGQRACSDIVNVAVKPNLYEGVLE